MGTLFEELEKRARTLTREEKAALAHLLIADLDSATDANAEQLWVDEARRRHEAYLRGELEPVPGDEAMTRARARLK
jgi:Putative addiction module component